MNQLHQLFGSVKGLMLTFFMLAILVGCSTISSHQAEIETRQVQSVLAEQAPVVTKQVSEEIKPHPRILGPATFIVEDEVPSVQQPDENSLNCLTQAMYFEARGEGRKGLAAVGYVVTNRAADKRFPDTVCGVVRQGKHINGKAVKNQCQFGWYCDGRSDVIKPSKEFDDVRDIARRVLLKLEPNPVGRSVYFHGVHEKPFLKRYAARYRLGGHIFYT